MPPLASQIHQFFYTLLAIPRAWRFMLHFKLWRGLRDYGWVARGLAIVGLIAGIFLVKNVGDWFRTSEDLSFWHMLFGENSLLSNISGKTLAALSNGSLKWVILILMEVVIYHFMRSSLKIVLGKDVKDAHKMGPFIKAQWRMIWVSVTAFIIELIFVNVFFQVAQGVIPFLGYFVPIATLIVQAYLLGFAIVDNYNEQFEISVEQSLGYVRRGYMGVCLGLGVPLYFLMLIPIIGPFLAPLLTSVTAAIVMKELSDLHLVGYIPSEKEQKQLDKKERKQEKKDRSKARKAAKKRIAAAKKKEKQLLKR